MANKREVLPLSRREIEEDLFATQYRLILALHEAGDNADIEATQKEIKRALRNIEGDWKTYDTKCLMHIVCAAILCYNYIITFPLINKYNLFLFQIVMHEKLNSKPRSGLPTYQPFEVTDTNTKLKAQIV